MLLGDDIVIGNDKVAREYKSLLMEWDMPFSPDKTYTSAVGFEFAKQIRYNNINISPLSLSSFHNNRNDYKLCISFLVEELRNKEWNVDSGVWIDTYLRGVQKFSSKRYQKVKPFVNLSLAILEYLQGRSINLGDHLDGFVTEYYSDSEFSNKAFSMVFASEVLRRMMLSERQTRMRSSQDIFRTKNNLRIFKLLKIIGKDINLRSNFTYKAIPFTSYFQEDVITPIVLSLQDRDSGVMLTSIEDFFSPEMMRSIYSVDKRLINLSDYYARGREVLYKTSWSIANEFNKNASEVNSIKVNGLP